MAFETPETVSAVVGRLFAAGHPGFELLDRDLVLARHRRVPYVGVDELGRLVLVLCLEPEAGDAAALALDALAFARARSTALVKHLNAPRLRTPLAAVVWVVARGFGADERVRLARLEPGAVRMFECVCIESQRSVGEYLLEVSAASETAPSATVAPAATSPSAPLAGLPQPLRELAESVIRRVEHLDDDLDATRTPDHIAWRFQDELVCSVSLMGGELAGAVPGGDFDGAIAGPSDVERFLGAAVQRYLAVLGHGDLIAVPRPSTPAPLLTPEELAAFDPKR
ncbi:MAG: hypothetical protein FJ294_12650 [Planctomycetes bacterium]|nr:hypothetical protein [Planctomycetota bacterium]